MLFKVAIRRDSDGAAGLDIAVPSPELGAVGVKRESDPHNWVISNGNLYVFAGERGVQNFTQNPDEMAAKAAKAAANLKTLKALATQ